MKSKLRGGDVSNRVRLPQQLLGNYEIRRPHSPAALNKASEIESRWRETLSASSTHLVECVISALVVPETPRQDVLRLRIARSSMTLNERLRCCHAPLPRNSSAEFQKAKRGRCPRRP